MKKTVGFYGENGVKHFEDMSFIEYLNLMNEVAGSFRPRINNPKLAGIIHQIFYDNFIDELELNIENWELLPNAKVAKRGKYGKN